MLNIRNSKLKKKGVKMYSVLVVEPDLVYQYILRKHFDERKVDLDFTADLNEGFKMVEDKSYALIFLDIPYLVNDVINLIVKIRKLDAYKTVPIIGVTMMLRQEVLASMKDAGLCEVVLRPYNPKVILSHYLGVQN